MNRNVARYQFALEQEKLRLCNIPVAELLALEHFTTRNIQVDDKQIQFAVWHEEANERSNGSNHSFILQPQRRIFLIFRRNYLVGFAVDETDNVVSIEESVLHSYD